MGISCTSPYISTSKTLNSLPYSELDKIILLEFHYMNDTLDEKTISHYYPQIDFKALKFEKDDKVKHRHFIKWYLMSYNTKKSLLSNEIIESLKKIPVADNNITTSSTENENFTSTNKNIK